MRKGMLVLAAAGLCTANTVTTVVAQTLDVVDRDGKTVSTRDANPLGPKSLAQGQSGATIAPRPCRGARGVEG